MEVVVNFGSKSKLYRFLVQQDLLVINIYQLLWMFVTYDISVGELVSLISLRIEHL